MRAVDIEDDGSVIAKDEVKPNLKCGNLELFWSNENEAYVLYLGDDVGQVLIRTQDRGTHWQALFQLDEWETERHNEPQHTADALNELLIRLAKALKDM